MSPEVGPSLKSQSHRQLKAPAEYNAGLDRAIEKGWLVLHESGKFVRFTDRGAPSFA